MINYCNSRLTLHTEVGALFLLWLVNWIFSGVHFLTVSVDYFSINKDIICKKITGTAAVLYKNENLL